MYKLPYVPFTRVKSMYYFDLLIIPGKIKREKEDGDEIKINVTIYTPDIK